MIPQHQIKHIREAANNDIVSVIEHFGPELDISTHRGTKGKALCPFHDEKTPSFHVSERKGIYKCFGCGEGGDAVDFLIKHNGYDFIEAIRELAGYLNIVIQEVEGGKSQAYTATDPMIPGIKEAKRHIRKAGEARLCFSNKDAEELQKRGYPNAVYLKAYRPPHVQLIARYTDRVIIYPRGLNKRKFFKALKITARQNLSIKIAKHASDQPMHWPAFFIMNYERTKELREKCIHILASFENGITRAVEQQNFTKQWNNKSKAPVG